jgi:hypothetical protein
MLQKVRLHLYKIGRIGEVQGLAGSSYPYFSYFCNPEFKIIGVSILCLKTILLTQTLKHRSRPQ